MPNIELPPTYQATAAWEESLVDCLMLACQRTGIASGMTTTATTVTLSVAAASSGGQISSISSWSSPLAGQLRVNTTAGLSNVGGVVYVQASNATVAIVTYAGLSGGNTLTGCVCVGGSAFGTTNTVQTGSGITSYMHVTVAAGYCEVLGAQFRQNPAGTVAIAGPSTNDRKDLIIYTPGVGLESSGTNTTNSANCTGTPCGVPLWTTASGVNMPVCPPVPAGSVFVDYVYLVGTAAASPTYQLSSFANLWSTAVPQSATPQNAVRQFIVNDVNEIIFGNATTFGSATLDNLGNNGPFTHLNAFSPGNSGVWVATGDIQCQNLTINNGASLLMLGYRLQVQGALTIQGGGSISAGVSGSTNVLPAGSLGGAGSVNGVGGNGANLSPATVASFGGQGCSGGTGNPGGGVNARAGGNGTTGAPTNLGTALSISGYSINQTDVLMILQGVLRTLWTNASAATVPYCWIGGGVGGGAGGGSASNAGGAGGVGGGVMVIAARLWLGAGIVSANGAAGSNGTGGNAGGGGGGGGGVLIPIWSNLTPQAAGLPAGLTFQVNAGAPGLGAGTGSNGVGPTAANQGTIFGLGI